MKRTTEEDYYYDEKFTVSKKEIKTVVIVVNWLFILIAITLAVLCITS